MKAFPSQSQTSIQFTFPIRENEYLLNDTNVVSIIHSVLNHSWSLTFNSHSLSLFPSLSQNFELLLAIKVFSQNYAFPTYFHVEYFLTMGQATTKRITSSLEREKNIALWGNGQTSIIDRNRLRYKRKKKYTKESAPLSLFFDPPSYHLFRHHIHRRGIVTCTYIFLQKFEPLLVL